MRKNSNAATEPSGRVYLLRALSIARADGSTVLYPAGYYGRELEPTATWLEDGRAIPEADYVAREAAQQAAAPVEPAMHPAGPKEPPATSAAAPAGNMWAHGPKDSQIPAVASADVAQAEHSAVNGEVGGTPVSAGKRPSAETAAQETTSESAGVQTPAENDNEE